MANREMPLLETLPADVVDGTLQPSETIKPDAAATIRFDTTTGHVGPEQPPNVAEMVKKRKP